jgi:hypothetical protein
LGRNGGKREPGSRVSLRPPCPGAGLGVPFLDGSTADPLPATLERLTRIPEASKGAFVAVCETVIICAADRSVLCTGFSPGRPSALRRNASRCTPRFDL